MTAAKKLPPIKPERETYYTQGHVDRELRDEVVKALPAGMHMRDALQRGLLHVLMELNPSAAKRLVEVLK